ncbi:hypothetical protein TNCV_3661971 [Trichonephila clavipes]|nr:hypothetical protein TNCV_3661971 [Trichonephila clavipes]
MHLKKSHFDRADELPAPITEVPYVWPTTGVRVAPCHDEFCGPRSDYVRQVALETTTTTTKYGKHQKINEMFEKTSVLLGCLIVSPEEFAVDDNVCKAPIMADKDFLECLQSSKMNDENEENNAGPIPTSCEIRIMKSMCSYLEAHSNGEINERNGQH